MSQRWMQRLDGGRLGDPRRAEPLKIRSPFQQDYDRIVFSSAFRRLQDKTQVFPLSESDYVRTRLTHSLEAASVGRSLGTLVGETLVARHGLSPLTPADFGAVVAAAALGHDLGNPPFGHSGEDAIRHWFDRSPLAQQVLGLIPPERRGDFLEFEGNAQGFRILTRLQNPDNPGGLQLTHGVLGAFAKYPRVSGLSEAQRQGHGVSAKKISLFHAELDHFKAVAKATGLNSYVPGQYWARHPLAFLVEAADDICYLVVDLEDGFRQGVLSFDQCRELLGSLIDEPPSAARLAKIRSPKDQVAYLRARAINTLIDTAAEAFVDHEDALLEGRFDQNLIESTHHGPALAEIKRHSFDKIYTAQPVVEIEAAGFEVMGGLLSIYVEAVEEWAASSRPSPWAKIITRLLPRQFLGEEGRPSGDAYERLLRITDFVSGMTDSFAVATYKRIKGISLPVG